MGGIETESRAAKFEALAKLLRGAREIARELGLGGFFTSDVDHLLSVVGANAGEAEP